MQSLSADFFFTDKVSSFGSWWIHEKETHKLIIFGCRHIYNIFTFSFSNVKFEEKRAFFGSHVRFYQILSEHFPINNSLQNKQTMKEVKTEKYILYVLEKYIFVDISDNFVASFPFFQRNNPLVLPEYTFRREFVVGSEELYVVVDTDVAKDSSGSFNLCLETTKVSWVHENEFF